VAITLTVTRLVLCLRPVPAALEPLLNAIAHEDCDVQIHREAEQLVFLPEPGHEERLGRAVIAGFVRPLGGPQ
jgi:hypothetical protein